LLVKPLIRLPLAAWRASPADQSHFQFIPIPSDELLYKAG